MKIRIHADNGFLIKLKLIDYKSVLLLTSSKSEPSMITQVDSSLSAPVMYQICCVANFVDMEKSISANFTWIFMP